MVDAVHDGQVDILARRRDQHLLGPRRDVLFARSLVGEEAGAFQDQVDAQFLVRQVRRVTLGGDADALAVDHDVVALGGDFARIAAMDAVAAEQPGVGLGIGEIVDRDQFESAFATLEDRTRDQTTDAAETVDCNLDRHASKLLSLSGRAWTTPPPVRWTP